jgi:acyl transferase domain-containing protein
MTDQVAVIGFACRFPGAADADEFWENLQAGIESITFFTDERGTADYVNAAPLLDDYDRFDAAFFGFSPREAELMDPQHRVFLECAWTAMEHAGHDPGRVPGPVGVYAGSAMNTYLLHSGVSRQWGKDYLLTLTASDKDYLASRVAYKLGLTGPAITVQTACSTSLVAVHLATQSLLVGECDLALAGGVAVKVPHRAGYPYQPGGVVSPDGHCRAFDARASGTVFGSGAGVVVLRRLDDALADGDHVHAVLLGSAVNNDGSSKVDFAAPSVDGQAEVVIEALAHAGVDANTLSYVEAHGTGTAIGDPAEVAALTKAFGTDRRQFCALGSVKTNVGHLDAAAGIAGLLKTVLALEHAAIPATLHFREPNPDIDFPSTPFTVNSSFTRWEARPRRAGVSSLGVGGTNAHVVLAEPPPQTPSGDSRPYHLLVLSARTSTALETATENLRRYLTRPDAAGLADVAHTLQCGRKASSYRRVLVGRNRLEVAGAAVLDGVARSRVRPVIFMFPGGGSLRSPLGSELYGAEPVFRTHFDRGCAELAQLTGRDFRGAVLHGGDTRLDLPSVQLPALFVIEEALAALWLSWGVRPDAMIGHSVGEITAACLAGVFSYTDALRLVVARGRLMERTAPGAMLGVHLPAGRMALPADLDLAAVNTPASCAVSGPVPAIEAFRQRLTAEGVASGPVPFATAAHSRLYDPILPEFEEHVRGLAPAAPSTPFISGRSGTWITPDQARDPAYWAGQFRHTVRFADGARELLAHPDRVFLEVGPARSLSTFVLAHPDRRDQPVIPSLDLARPGVAAVITALGRLWLAGVEVDWAGFAAGERRHRVPLPTYPFERTRYWLAEDVSHPGLRARIRAALARRRRRPKPARETPTTGDVVPRTPTERTVAGIFASVLGLTAVSVHDDFFQLGGGSLLLTEVIRRVNTEFALDLALLTLVESPTVATLSARIDAVR